MRIQLVSLLIFLSTFFQSVQAQQDGIPVLGINLENYEYPFPVHYLNLDVQQQALKMAYMDVQPATPNGKAILLLHGKNFNGAYWQTTADTLAALGFRVIIPDQVGFGKSTKPAHFQYSIHQLARNTKMLLDSLGITKVIVTGHSMGGMIATRFALMYPETTSKLLLADPIGLEDWKLKVPYKPVDWWYQRELKSNAESIRKYQQASYYHGTWKPEYEQWVKPLAGWTKNPDYSIIAWNAALTYDMIFTQPVLYEFDKLTCPVLLLVGDQDKTALGKDQVPADVAATMGNYPALAKQTQARIKNCELVILKGVGHLPQIEAFDKFIAGISAFLKT